MQIASGEVHRALTYLVATGRHGRPLPVDLFDSFASAPDPAKANYRTVGGIMSLTGDWNAFAASLAGRKELVRTGEVISAYLARVGWAEIAEDSISPTPLGSVVLQALNSPTVDVSNDDPVTVVIDPEDPLAYTKVFGLIVSRGDGLLIDPYLGVKEFFELLEIGAVTRILLSDEKLTEKRPLFAKALGATDGRVEVRYVALKLLHDRFFVPDDGDVLVFGSSLNSLTRRPGVVTPLADATASNAIRAAYRAIWNNATPIQPERTDGEAPKIGK